MASGPDAGLNEIFIRAVHAGSSIMPGKVNPSLAECLNMICFNVVGNDLAVANAEVHVRTYRYAEKFPSHTCSKYDRRIKGKF